MIADMKAEKYVISTHVGDQTAARIRYGFGAAGEEVQKLLELPGLTRITVKIDGQRREVQFVPGGKPLRLVDIKARLKSLSFPAE